MRDYNTRVVVLGTTLLGLSAGVVGSFTLLRKRALMGDALSHATLPGIGIAFVVATQLGYNGKTLPILLLGATLSGMLGVGVILFIRKYTRLKEDAALSIVLSVFFGAGIVMMIMVQNLQRGHAAGLDSFIDGKTASMLASDVWLICGAGLAASFLCVLLYKELKLLCFDEAFAGSEGFSVMFLDIALMACVVVVTIVGLVAVGLLLMIALLVTPAAAARFWTQSMSRLLLISAAIGAVSGMTGSAVSALFPRLPSGPMIVLAATAMFLISMFFAPARGVIPRWFRRRRLNAKIDRQHLLRGVYELLERNGIQLDRQSEKLPTVRFDDLLAMRSWRAPRLRAEVRRAIREGLLESSQTSSIKDEAEREIRLTNLGHTQAARMAREHRLWEMYLITHAEIAPSQVDRDADAIEHVLDPEIIAKLEQLLRQEPSNQSVPVSPHPL